MTGGDRDYGWPHLDDRAKRLPAGALGLRRSTLAGGFAVDELRGRVC
jgi:hypothetical protein